MNEVKCTVCGRQEKVQVMACLRDGWPKCCGYTMRLSGRGGKEIIKQLRPAAVPAVGKGGGEKG